MSLLLAGDIGSTKTILRLVEEVEKSALLTIAEEKYSSQKYADLVPMLQEFLLNTNKKLGQEIKPDKVCFGIAAPVINNTSVLTNLGWTLEAERLQYELDVSYLSLINDFVAVGYGVSYLDPSTDFFTLQTGKMDREAPIAVIGAGTGLGEGFVIPQEKGVKVFGTEGGHADFAPRSQLEFQLLQYFRDKHNIDRVSVERVVSGQGIISIYQFLRDRHYAHEAAEISQIIRTWESEAGIEKTVDPARNIIEAALEKSDRLCEQTMRIFTEVYGAEAGNLALKLLPYGGLYVAGEIATQILPLIQEGCFLRAFSNKGRVSALLDKIPIHIVLNHQVGLIGAAVYASMLQ